MVCSVLEFTVKQEHPWQKYAPQLLLHPCESQIWTILSPVMFTEVNEMEMFKA